jgi:hypothetical protein
MVWNSARVAALLLAVSSLFAHAAQKPCVSAEEASKFVNKDVCVNAHIYDVVVLPSGMRFLDVCSPDTPDENCRFTIVSMWEDRGEVGELGRYRNADVHIRGIVQSMHGRAGIVLSHDRQFNGGPPKFKPNPKLAHGFSAEQDQPAISDPNLRSHGSHRAFMTTRDQLTRPAK